MIATTFSGEERGAAIGSWTAWTGVAFVIGPLVGGWLVTHASWRWVFLINVPIAIATAALVAYAVPKREQPRNERARVDVVGGVLCVLGLGGPVFALIEEPTPRLRRPADPRHALRRPRAACGVPLVGAACTRRRCSRSGSSRRRNFTFANIETLTVYAGALDADVLPRALPAAARGLLAATQRARAGPDHDRHVPALAARRDGCRCGYGPRLFMGVGPLVAAVAVISLVRLKPGFDYWTELLPPLLLFSVGLSMIVAPLTATVLADAGESDAGHRERRQQRGRARRGPARDRDRRRGDRRRRQQARPLGLPPGDVRSPPALVGVGGVIGLAGIRNRGTGGRRMSTAAEIVFDHVTKRYAGPRRGGARRPLARDPRRDVLRPRRPVGRRQDDRAEDGQPPDPVRLRRHPHRRPQRPRAAPSSSCGAGSAT